MWLSLFAVGSGGTTDRPPGVYGVAFVDYDDGGVLAYHEMFVARLVRDGVVPRVHITDIWVDSAPSREGGRSLWAIPKEMADLHVVDRQLGPMSRASCSADVRGRPVAAAALTGASALGVRTPLAFTTAQRREDGKPVVTNVSGSAKTLPCLAAWRFGSDGPLAWMHGRSPVASFRMSDLRLVFGA